MHPGAPEDFAHRVASGELKGRGIALGRVQEDRLSRHAARKLAIELLGQIGVVREERAKFESDPAGTQDAKPGESAAAPDPDSMPSRRPDPSLEEHRPGRGKVPPVVGIDLGKVGGGQLENVFRRRSIRADSFKPSVRGRKSESLRSRSRSTSRKRRPYRSFSAGRDVRADASFAPPRADLRSRALASRAER